MPIISNDYLGSILLASFNFAPNGYALCNGQLLSINQNAALFSLLGTTFGGNGVTTFGLPNLQGRTPIHTSGTYQLGNNGGTETVILTTEQMPAHTHSVSNVSVAARTGTTATQTSPVGGYLASNGTDTDRFGTGTDEHMVQNSLGSMTAAGSYQTAATGGGIPMSVMMPFTVISFCIALQGVFPSRN